MSGNRHFATSGRTTRATKDQTPSLAASAGITFIDSWRAREHGWSKPAEEILAEGFRDGRGNYLTDQVFEGVWFADQPLGINEEAHGDVVLAIDIHENEIADFEWVEEGKTYREWLLPAALVNALGPPFVVDRD